MRRATTLALILTSSLVAGCGGGLQTHDVSGTVTFNGKPVPAGRIDFFPDVGNDGIQGWAIIKDGAFDTRKPGGQGHAGGPMLIKIEGFDGISDDPNFPGTPIFPVYELKKDMPRGVSQETIEIPLSAAKDFRPPPKSKS